MFKLFKPQSAEAVAEIGIQGLFDNHLVQFTGLSETLIKSCSKTLTTFIFEFMYRICEWKEKKYD